MRVRAVGYTGSLLVVPVVWRLRGRQDPYPRELDLAVTLPLLGDAAGNAVGIYQRAHVDDAIHFANGAILASVVGRPGHAAHPDLLGGGGHRRCDRHVRGHGLGDRRMGRPQAGRARHEPELSRHDG